MVDYHLTGNGPSDKAVEHVRAFSLQPSAAEGGLRRGHDPALGLDRSVCLRDVVEALREWSTTTELGGLTPAESIRREFRGGEVDG